MDLSEEQIDWLVEHFVHPGRAWIKLPPLERLVELLVSDDEFIRNHAVRRLEQVNGS